MRVARTLGACVVALLICGAVMVGAAAASVDVRWTAEGKPRSLTEPKWKLVPTPSGVGLEDVYEGTAGYKDIWGVQAGSGQIVGGRLTMSGELNGAQCTSEGSEPGVVTTELLGGAVGLVNAKTVEVGLELAPATKGGLFAKFTCGETTVELRGGVIGAVTPVNKPVTAEEHFTIDYRMAEPGQQAITRLLGRGTAHLEESIDKGPFVSAALIATDFSSSSPTEEISARAQGPVFYTKANIGSEAASVPFTGTVGAALLETPSKTTVGCTGGAVSGEASGPATANGVAVTFTGCESSGLKCESAGQAEGTIRTEVLEGTLGNVTASLPGLRLYSEAEGKGGTFAEFECGPVKGLVGGSVIGSLSGASGNTAAEGKLPSSAKLTLAQTRSVQKYVKFIAGEGEEGSEQLTASFDSMPPEMAGTSFIATLKSIPASNLGYTK